MTTETERKELFFDSAFVFNLPALYAYVRLVVLEGEFAERVAILTLCLTDDLASTRTVVDAHGQSNAELIRWAIKEFDSYVELERGKGNQ